MLFSYLANAMFATDDESDDPKDIKHAEKQKSRFINTIADSYLRGMGTGGASIAALKNGILSAAQENKKGWNADYGNTVIEMLNVSPPIGSKARKLYQSGKTWKYNQDEIKEMGLDINNPAVMAVANIISATTNLPTDRAVMKIDNIRNAMSDDFETWQRVAMFMGWNKWALGAEGGPAIEALESVEERLKKEKSLKKKKEKYNVDTEKEVIRIDKGKEIKNLNKNQQVKILKDLGYSDSQIKKLKKEEDRVNSILKSYDKDNDKIDKLIKKYPKNVKVKVKVEKKESGYKSSGKGFQFITKEKKKKKKSVSSGKGFQFIR
jgi:TusA-related sulfurtransferase